MATRVAVVGAGPVGLMSMKNFKEEGFDVTAFEARDYVGGLWKVSSDSTISIQDATIFNSSRSRAAFSDFPFDDSVDDFPTWRQMYKYFNDYCEHFDLRRHIHFNSRITNLTRQGGQWVLEVTPTDGKVRYETFDKVAIATGYFVKAKIPKISGIERFQGPVCHSLTFHTPSNYDGQNVLIVGLHATAQDVSKTLEGHAKQLYLAHRSGVVLCPRFMPDGATFDQTQTLNFVLFYNFFDKWFPALLSFAFNFLLRYMSKKVFTYQPKSWKLDPAPSILITPPLVGDEIYDLMKRGFAEPVDGIAEVTGPKSVRLVDGRILEDIDSIVYCTGYDAETPFLPPEFNAYPRIGDVGNLYRNVWLLHPDPKVRNSLAFIGQVGIPISGLAQFELHAMAVAQVWAGKTPLPSFAEMKAWHRRHLKYRESMYNKQKHKSVFYTAFVRFSDHLEWMNWAAGTGIFEHFSWFNWRSWAFWLRDRKFYYKVKSGLLTPAIWRLFDMGKRKPWDGARAQIYKDNEFAEMRRKLKREQLAKESREVNGHKKGR